MVTTAAQDVKGWQKRLQLPTTLSGDICFKVDSMHAAKEKESKLEFVTLDKESNMSTLWKREEFVNMCSKQQVSRKAKEVEEKLPVPKHQQARWESNPDSFFVDRFWGRRPDGGQSI